MGNRHNICNCVWPNELLLCHTRRNHGCSHGKLRDPGRVSFHLDTISVIFWVPVYDRIIVPIAQKRPNAASENGNRPIHINILNDLRCNIGVPQYFIIGCAEMFTFIGQLEFFYEQAPDAMRSMCSALSLLTVALGQHLSSLLITIVIKVTTRNGGPGWLPNNPNYGRLDYFFWLLMVLSVVNLIAFIIISRMYTCKVSVGTLR
ncbi:hypothetical protein PIB30_098150 [Stylosanthes scabra]|uniref:Uncharacterized protein n=1 Tax=Stylosanthes scabra TaxID=79078 RepID=A0ABU6RWY7_9FABA|nr:hypothetical protein [Stylosanthes scabra]